MFQPIAGVVYCKFNHRSKGSIAFVTSNRASCTRQRNNFWLLLFTSTGIKLSFSLSFSDWFRTKRKSVWFHRQIVYTIWFQFDLTKFRKDFSVCNRVAYWHFIIYLLIWIKGNGRWLRALNFENKLIFFNRLITFCKNKLKISIKRRS